MIDRKTTQILLAALVLVASMALVIQSPWDDSEAASDGPDGSPARGAAEAVGISLNKSNIAIHAGDDVSLVATVTGCTDAVTWSSSDSLKVAVDQGGKLTPKAYGTATITAAVGGASASCKVNVEYADMAVSPASLTLIQGNSGSLSLTLPDGYSNVVWRTSGNSVATVSGSGASATVRGVGVGNATITAICGNLYKATCAVTVTEKPATVSTYTFLLKMEMDASLADVGTSGLTAEDLEEGITLTGRGYNAGAALESALRSEGIPCSFWSGSTGGQDLLYWVDSIMGLGDVHYANGDWKYWIQYHYSGGKYVYNDLTLGHYTEGGSFKIVYGITSDPSMSKEAAVPSPVSGLVYNGKTQTGVPSGEGYTITNNTAINAGTYSAKLTLKSGYTWAGGATGTKTVSWSISKAVLTAKYAGETISEGSTPAYRVTVSGFVNGETASTATNFVAPKVTNSDLSVGSHTLTPSGGSAKNYSFQYSSGVLTVVASGTAVVPSPSALTYNGQTQTGVPSGTGYSVSGGSAKDAGTYTARLTLSSGYKWADGTTAAKTVKWTISKAVLTAKYPGETIAEGSTPAYRVTVSGFVNGETASTASGYVAPTVTSSDLSVGSHTLTPSGGSAKNYTFQYRSGVLTVASSSYVPEIGSKATVSGLVYTVVSVNPLEAALTGYSGSVSNAVVESSVNIGGTYFPVKSVADKALYNCSTLKSLDLGSVETVGLKAFANCSALKTLTVPDTVSLVKGYAFYGCGILSLDIPGDGTVLEASAFSACKKMSTITFSGAGAVIGANAFYKNNGVTSVDLSTVASVGTKAFPYCNGMRTLTIPGHLTSVGSYAFYKCANLTDLVVEEGVQKILSSAFSGCTSLRNVSLPESLTYLGANAFYGIKFLDYYGAAVDATVGNLRGHDFSGANKVLRMQNDPDYVDGFTVDGVRYTVTSYDSVTATGYEGAASVVPCSVTYNGHEYQVTSIGNSAFLKCSTLRSVDLSNVKDVGFKAFGSCAGITDITFGSGLRSLGDYSLYGLSFYDGSTKLTASPYWLRGHSFSGSGGILYLTS